MGLPESTNKTHRLKNTLRKFSLVFQLQPCMFSPVPISQSPVCPVWGGCCDTAGEHQPLVQISHCNEAVAEDGFCSGLQRQFLHQHSSDFTKFKFVRRVWSLLTQSLDCIIPSINLSASIIKPLGHRVAAQLFHNLNPLVAAMPVFFPAYVY